MKMHSGTNAGGDFLENLSMKSKEVIMKKAIQVQGCTDKGSVRPHNEDYHGYYIPTDEVVRNKWGSLFVISDGVGGNAAGEVASAEAVNVLLQEFYFGDHSERIPDRLKNAAQYTAMHIYDLSSNHTNVQNMKCTMSALLIKHDKFFITHVGDSKIFLIRSNKIIQLTKDHSLVGKLVRLGLVSQESARTHPNKHILLKALGDQPIMPADFYSGHVQNGDLFCMVTDGMLEHETEEELKTFLEVDGYSEESLNKLITLMNQRGGYDNMTILTVKINNVNEI
jgi:PPM family protein phosphatase